VILVDFRGFDTLGEISVLLIASVGIGAMLHGLDLKSSTTPRAPQPPSLLLTTLAAVLLPFALLIAVHLFVRGHNLPGGGFVAGLTAAVAVLLQYVAHDGEWATQRLRISWQRISCIGVLIAIATGVGSWVLGYPFLTSSFGHWQLPIVGDIELATAMLFDLGVFLTVLGAVLRMLLQSSGRSMH
jgi:multicomponent K+:H+ antiporter subunit A